MLFPGTPAFPGSSVAVKFPDSSAVISTDGGSVVKRSSVAGLALPSSLSLMSRLTLKYGTQAVEKKNKFGHFLVVVQLIHRLTQADISCTTTVRLFFFPLVDGTLLPLVF